MEHGTEVHPLDAVLISLGRDASPEDRLAAAFMAFTETTEVELSNPPTEDEREAVAKWLTRQLVDEGLTLMAKFPTLQSTLYPRTSDKASRVTQMPCLSCDWATDGQAIDFAVRVKPFSMQSRIGRETGAELKRAIRGELQARELTNQRWVGPICLSVMVLYGRSDRDKDADNSVKGLLDAFNESVYEDDAQIQHLSVHKLRHEGADRFYQVTARQVCPADADVVHRNTFIRWQRPEIVVRAPEPAAD